MQVIGAIFAMFMLAWMTWASASIVKMMVLAARVQPILDFYYADLKRPILTHSESHSLTTVEQEIYDEFARSTDSISDEALELLRRGADRESKDPANPPELQALYAALQGACRSEQQARKLKGFWRKIAWSFTPWHT